MKTDFEENPNISKEDERSWGEIGWREDTDEGSGGSIYLQNMGGYNQKLGYG